MSSTIADSKTTRLRLSSARRKVAAFLDQIRHLEASDFAHDDAREGLEFIRNYFTARLASISTLPPKVRTEIVDKICGQTSRALARYTDVLGFILRSTNVRNAFEVHFPLKRLVRDIVSPEAQLILSSEWDFIPFTYPMTLDLLPNFVLIGAPAPESGNVLIIPLAGHEIGHSVWRTGVIRETALNLASYALADAIKSEPERFDQLVTDLGALKMSAEKSKEYCLSSVIRQLEEVFCDILGLYIFGASYLYAYDYFLAPGAAARSAGYPADASRIGFLLDAARALNITVDPGLFADWQSPSAKGLLEQEVLFFADAAVASTVASVQALAFDHLKACGVTPPDPAVVARIRAAFEDHVPDGAGGSLAEIVCAGWDYLRDKGGLASEDEQAEYGMLNELMLKSIEVSEFLLRVKADA